MGRSRKPTNLLVLNGSVDHDKKRYANRMTEPKPSGKLGAPPKHLPDEFIFLFMVVVISTPAGVLTSADRIIVELTARLTVKMRTGLISTGETTQLISCLSRLGLTPADRSRVNTDPSQVPNSPLVPQSPFAQFAR